MSYYMMNISHTSVYVMHMSETSMKIRWYLPVSSSYSSLPWYWTIICTPLWMQSSSRFSFWVLVSSRMMWKPCSTCLCIWLKRLSNKHTKPFRTSLYVNMKDRNDVKEVTGFHDGRLRKDVIKVPFNFKVKKWL